MSSMSRNLSLHKHITIKLSRQRCTHGLSERSKRPRAYSYVFFAFHITFLWALIASSRHQTALFRS